MVSCWIRRDLVSRLEVYWEVEVTLNEEREEGKSVAGKLWEVGRFRREAEFVDVKGSGGATE